LENKKQEEVDGVRKGRMYVVGEKNKMTKWNCEGRVE
jgi:hypothetical protein